MQNHYAAIKLKPKTSFGITYARIDFLGLKFKRQKPIGGYIVDFVCWEQRLVIELDGGQHAEQIEYDIRRTQYLESEGYKVLRFWNNDVQSNIEGVLEKIRLEITLSPTPLPQAGEGNQV